jgi:aminomethyltransferase
LPNNSGGIVDDLLVYQLREEEYMLVVNASNIEKDWEWINQHNDSSAILENISYEVTLLALQGPKAKDILRQITSVNLDDLAYYTFTHGNIDDITSGVIISATGYTGAGGFELYMYNEYASQVWQKIMEAGADHGLKPAGLGARDTLRLEMGYCLYGNDIDDSTSPLEAGLGWITKFTKDFVNSEFLLKQKQDGVERKLVGFEMLEKGIPRGKYPLYNEDEKQVGAVTSGTMSPSLNKGIGMGYVTLDYSAPGTGILVGIRNRLLKAEIVKIPFLRG